MAPALAPAALFGLLGARLYFILENNPGYYLDPKNVGQALSLWQGGLSFYGGIFAGVVGAWIYTSRHNLPVLRYLDVGALITPLGLAIGRLGSLINGDISGYPTAGWGVEYSSPDNPLLPPRAFGRTQQRLASSGATRISGSLGLPDRSERTPITNGNCTFFSAP